MDNLARKSPPESVNASPRFRSAPPGSRQELLSFSNAWQILRRNVTLFLVIFALGATTVTAMHRLLPSFRARSTIVLQAAINNPLQSLSSRIGGFSGFDVDGREVDRYIARLRVYNFYSRLAQDVLQDAELGAFPQNVFFRSKPLGVAIREKMGRKDERLVRDLDRETVIERLGEIVSFTKDGIDTVSIHAIAVDRELLYRLSVLVSKATVRALVEYEVSDLNDSDQYLKMQETNLSSAMRETEREMAEFKKEKRLFSITAPFDFSNQRSGELQREIAQVQAQVDELQLEARRISKRRDEVGSASEDAEYKFGLKRKLALIDESVQELRARRKKLEGSLEGLYKKVDENSEQRILQFKSKLDLDGGLYQELRKHAFQMQMRRISAENKFKLLDAARENSIQVSESLGAKLLIVLCASLGLSILLGLLIEKAFPLVRGLADLQNLGLFVLGNVPLGKGVRRYGLLPPKKARRGEERFTPFMREEINNSMLHIRARLLRLAETAPPGPPRGRVVVVSSSEEGEGKSFSARHLAATLADACYKVLLIDGDLRSPSLTERLGHAGAEGLTEVLAKRDNFGQVRLTLPGGVTFLAAGRNRQNPSRLLSGQDFENLVRDFTALYDFVVIDTPPLCVASDAAIISRYSDVPVLVVAYNQVYQQAIHQSLDMLQSFNNGPIYAILNKTSFARQYGYFVYGSRKRYYSRKNRDRAA